MNWRYLLLVPVLTILILYTGKYITTAPLIVAWIIVSLTVGIITFLKPGQGLIVMVFSMLLSPELKLASIPGRDIVVRIDDILIIVIAIAWLAHIAMDKEWKGFVKTPLDRPLLVLLVIYAISTTNGIIFGNLNAVKSLFYVLKYFEYFLLYWITANIITSRNDIPRYLYAGLITSAAVTLYAYSLFGQTLRVYGPFDISRTLAGKAGEAASLGGYFLIILGVVLAFYIMSEKRGWLYLIFFLSILPPFIRTLSRASYTSFAVMMVAVLFIAPKKKFILASMLVAGIVFFPMIASNYYETMLSRIQGTFQGRRLSSYQLGAYNVEVEQSAAARFNNWKKAANVWLVRKPFIGHGVSGVGLVDTQYPLLIGEIGILGFLAFFYVIGKIFWFSFKSLKNAASSRIDKTLALGLITALIGLLVQGIAVNTFIIVRIMEPFWFLTALVVGVPKEDAPSEALNAHA
ncbi:MAG: hypothetical protein ABII64_01425 [Elusimicrobiota bacterium]